MSSIATAFSDVPPMQSISGRRLAFVALVIFVPLALFVHEVNNTVATWRHAQRINNRHAALDGRSEGSTEGHSAVLVSFRPGADEVASVLAPQSTGAAAAVVREGGRNGASLDSRGARARPKVLTEGDFSKVDWGSVVTEPLTEQNSEWCKIELQSSPVRRQHTYDPQCAHEPLRQGNYTDISDILRFSAHFPFIDRTPLQSVSAAEIRRYWQDNPDPLRHECKTCVGGLSHTTLYSARRWWRCRTWRRGSKIDGTVEKLSLSVVLLYEDKFVAFDSKVNGGDFERVPSENITIPFSEVNSIRICRDEDEEGGYASFVIIEGTQHFHVLQFVLQRPGVHCFWRSLQLLLPELATTRVFQVFDRSRTGNMICPDYNVVASRLSSALKGYIGPVVSAGTIQPRTLGTEKFRDLVSGSVLRKLPRPLPLESTPEEADLSRLVRMPQDVEFPYLPCHRFRLSSLYATCERHRCYDNYRNFWPFKCEKHRLTNQCGWEEEVAARGVGVSQAIRVAVSFSGFFRSFAHARGQIWSHVVMPHNATVFAATWNVPGRAKKTKEITKKDVLPVSQMLAVVRDMLYFPSDAPTQGRIEVYDFLRVARFHEVLKQNGFSHPGLYFTLARSVMLVKEWEEKHESRLFDIIIRTRFDLWPSVPLRFVRVTATSVNSSLGVNATHWSIARFGENDPHEYVLDVGSSCQTQGAWWPQSAKFHEGKLLKHNADTRFKLWTWQVCDWIEIGTRNTMYEAASIFDWVQANNVWSGAQFVDHAFLVDRGISYQPLQLFLKILRHRNQVFG